MNGSMLLKADDILDMRGLVRELCDPDHPVAQHLASMLPGELLKQLQKQNEEGFVRRGLAGELLDELNRLLADRCIYEPKSFQYARLTESTLSRTRKRLSGEELILANRLLLTEAFPCIFRLVYSRESKDPQKSEEWRRFHVDKYATLRPDYERFCGLLEQLLGEARAACAPLAIIQVRAKTVSSFAEKAWRKNYENPLCQSTDLAAARVITETQEEVVKVSEWLKKNFLIDEVNSVDHREKLKADEFGYLSVHYVASLKKDVVERLAPGKWYFLAGKKAEIQIRTLLQHAHASVVHDRVYKSVFTVPENLRRDLARVAALLEEADTAFAQTIASIEAYKGSYGAFMDEKRRAVETEVLEAVLQHEKDPVAKAEAALKLALIKKAAWDWRGVADTLRDYLGTSFQEQPRLRMEYGYALCRVHEANPKDQAYTDGVESLKRAVESFEGDPLVYPSRLRVEAHSCLAWAYGNRDYNVHGARDQYELAHRIDPTNPYILAPYIGFEIGAGGTSRDTVSQLMGQTIMEATKRCQEHVRAGVELPWAYLTMGRLYLLAGKTSDSLSAYCKAIHLGAAGFPAPDGLKSDKPGFPREILDDELGFLGNIGRQRRREEDEWVRDLLLLGLYAKYGAADALDVLKTRSLQVEDVTAPVVIVSGGTHPDVENEMRSYADCLEQGFEGFRGTLVSGGTNAGIPGMVGERAEQLQKKGLEVHARCYLPEKLPADAPPDSRYDQRISGVGAQFSPRQLIQTWIDLLVAGVAPSEVKLLGFNGGPLTLLEYRLALAMGALVGIIRESGRAASDLAPDPDWADARNLLWLPRDPMAVWAFVSTGAMEEAPYVEDMGRQIHENFLSETWPRSKDRIIRPWHYLDEDIKESNIQQAAFAETILRRNGYGVRKKKRPITRYRFGRDEEEAVQRMGEMEHGRWIVERLRSGWRYGPKDDTKRISPYLIPWKELTDKIRKYDCDFVREWPELLAKAGLEVYPLHEGD
ncbi:MAG: hypothetical protein A2W26_09665 [Acidobacteria bacterium RBG_16_64_8]|nr:MAG: hypothetical protein A2W26_09665 [Acidobacteria bacterium RBG_16_64_8]